MISSILDAVFPWWLVIIAFVVMMAFAGALPREDTAGSGLAAFLCMIMALVSAYCFAAGIFYLVGRGVAASPAAGELPTAEVSELPTGEMGKLTSDEASRTAPKPVFRSLHPRATFIIAVLPCVIVGWPYALLICGGIFCFGWAQAWLSLASSSGVGGDPWTQ